MPASKTAAMNRRAPSFSSAGCGCAWVGRAWGRRRSRHRSQNRGGLLQALGSVAGRVVGLEACGAQALPERLCGLQALSGRQQPVELERLVLHCFLKLCQRLLELTLWPFCPQSAGVGTVLFELGDCRLQAFAPLAAQGLGVQSEHRIAWPRFLAEGPGVLLRRGHVVVGVDEVVLRLVRRAKGL